MKKSQKVPTNLKILKKKKKNHWRKKEENNYILLVLPFEEISILPELSSQPRFRIQGGSWIYLTDEQRTKDGNPRVYYRITREQYMRAQQGLHLAFRFNKQWPKLQRKYFKIWKCLGRTCVLVYFLFTWVYLYFPWFTRIYRYLTEFTTIYLNSPKFSWIFLDLPKFT